jgi:2'-5' RNA ligase
MRTFIALLFEDEPRDIIHDITGEIRVISESGSFTNKNNLHLTIVYIGETSAEELEVMKKKLSEIEIKKFDYKTNRIKYFKKSNSRIIVYLGVDKIEPLENLYNNVRIKLKESGLNLHSEKYTPHITLGRQVKVKKNESLHNVYCNSLDLKATSISIMESKRVNDRLIYEELYRIPLK